MLQFRFFSLLFITLFSILLVLGGCINNTQPSIEPTPAPVPSPSEQPAEKPNLIDLRIQPEHLVLSPDSKYKISIMGTFSDQSTADVLQEQASKVTFSSSDPEAVTINEDGIIDISADANIGSSVMVQAEFNEFVSELSVTVSYSLEDTVTAFEDGIGRVTNPASVAVVVNKQRGLPTGYVPEDLASPNVPFSFSGDNERRYLRSSAAAALEALFKGAKDDGIILTAVSGYRTFQTQTMLFKNYVLKDGEEAARMYSAYPGTSEHQTGLAMDVSTPSIDNRIGTSANFGQTEEGIWLAENAPSFGFIIRYPKGKEDITGYVYEPWHLRYVGKELANVISEQGITLEEFFADSIPVSQNVE